MQKIGNKVIILGAGIAGLTAAHELAERGFSVAILEQRESAGGKARSFGTPGTGSGGRRDLPAEHGFRFFPSFYRHLRDTMCRIPYRGQHRGVLDNLVSCPESTLISESYGSLAVPNRSPRTPVELGRLLTLASAWHKAGETRDLGRMLSKMLSFLMMSNAQREATCEYVDWVEFIQPLESSASFAHLLDELPRLFVSLRGHRISARTCALMVEQLSFDALWRGGMVHVLNGPTSDVFITPWVEHLVDRGVKIELGMEVEAIHVRAGKIEAVSGTQHGRPFFLAGDYFICALPAHKVPALVNEELREAAPSLAGIEKLNFEWMNGVQIYLRRPMDHFRGHVTLVDSPWALTAIAQAQFWPGVALSSFGDGSARDVISVCVSDWKTPGALHEKPAERCSPGEIKEEVWAQLKNGLASSGASTLLREDDVCGWCIDPALRWDASGRIHNEEPIFVHDVGSLQHRPDSVTSIENFFLAGDYVRTHTDLACMEGACEAGRRAVNGILAASRVDRHRCEILPLQEPAFSHVLRFLSGTSVRAQSWLRGRGAQHDHHAARPGAMGS